MQSYHEQAVVDLGGTKFTNFWTRQQSRDIVTKRAPFCAAHWWMLIRSLGRHANLICGWKLRSSPCHRRIAGAASGQGLRRISDGHGDVIASRGNSATDGYERNTSVFRPKWTRQHSRDNVT
ncbi:hypothetical protein HPB47_024409 [Ixodes persulcatus]|uniref:Uncharacterized protein n=2 Tax=Ixodes persulcatus TaxID=34615 RepID=A0AC60Q4Z5_IXOPE|nr:hypothetical protein HPB47_004305 [Ixodes persulcatus]KAG0428622.1 hypothetical protein HPB47_024409 [Ixodes persulcatus]